MFKTYNGPRKVVFPRSSYAENVWDRPEQDIEYEGVFDRCETESTSSCGTRTNDKMHSRPNATTEVMSEVDDVLRNGKDLVSSSSSSSYVAPAELESCKRASQHQTSLPAQHLHSDNNNLYYPPLNADFNPPTEISAFFAPQAPCHTWRRVRFQEIASQHLPYEDNITLQDNSCNQNYLPQTYAYHSEHPTDQAPYDIVSNACLLNPPELGPYTCCEGGGVDSEVPQRTTHQTSRPEKSTESKGKGKMSSLIGAAIALHSERSSSDLPELPSIAALANSRSGRLLEDEQTKHRSDASDLSGGTGKKIGGEVTNDPSKGQHDRSRPPTNFPSSSPLPLFQPYPIKKTPGRKKGVAIRVKREKRAIIRRSNRLSASGTDTADAEGKISVSRRSSGRQSGRMSGRQEDVRAVRTSPRSAQIVIPVTKKQAGPVTTGVRKRGRPPLLTKENNPDSKRWSYGVVLVMNNDGVKRSDYEIVC